MKIIQDSIDAEGLATVIMAPNRTKPICVITASLNGSEPFVNPTALEDELGSLCDFYYIDDPQITRELAGLLPKDAGVFGGAVRVYRADFSEDLSLRRSKLFNLRDAEQGAQKTPTITEEIWSAANAAGLLKTVEQRSVSSVATVKQFIGDARVLVQLESGGLATIQQELVIPDVPLEWVFQVDQRLSGIYDKELGVFIPTLSASSAEDLVDHFGLNSVTLGLVKELDRQTAKVAIIPNLEFEVSKNEITGNPLDVISSYLGIGDVIPVRIYRHPEGKIRLRMDDIDDDEPVLPALPILPGGEAWLLEGRDVPWGEPEPITEPIAIVEDTPAESEQRETEQPEPEKANFPVPGPGLLPGVSPDTTPAPTAKELSELRFNFKHLAQENNRLKDQNARLAQERQTSDLALASLSQRVQEQAEELSKLRAQASEQRKAKRAQQTNRSTTFSRRDRFSSDQDWFQEELRRAWIGRYSPQERENTYPLDFNQVLFSEDFFHSILGGKLDEDEGRKLIRVALDLISGRNAIEHKHTYHALQDGIGGPQRVREDGALCWRMHLENGQPQAKRLHYWQLRDGRIELGWVANHDDDL